MKAAFTRFFGFAVFLPIMFVVVSQFLGPAMAGVFSPTMTQANAAAAQISKEPSFETMASNFILFLQSAEALPKQGEREVTMEEMCATRAGRGLAPTGCAVQDFDKSFEASNGYSNSYNVPVVAPAYPGDAAAEPSSVVKAADAMLKLYATASKAATGLQGH